MGKGTSRPVQKPKMPAKGSDDEEMQKHKSASWTCTFCKENFEIAKLSEAQLLIQQHLAKCPIKLGKASPNDLSANINKMINMKVFKGEQFYFSKVPVDSSNTVFRWKKEPFLPIDRSLSKKIYIDTRFQDKFILLRTQLEKKRISWQMGACNLSVDKQNVILSALPQLDKINFYKELKIKFSNDKVNDAGGLLRQWMHMVIRQIFQKGDFCIFERADTDELCYKINNDGEIDEQFACQILHFLGIVFGKALFQRMTLDCYLDRTFIRLLLGQPIQLSDIYSYDKGLYKSWKFILQCSEEELKELQLDFSIVRKQAGAYKKVVLLKQEDCEEPELVTFDNKSLYVKMCIEYYTFTVIRKPLQSFMTGFSKIVPLTLLHHFKPQEFQMMLYGVPFINVKDLQVHTVYKGEYNQKHPLINAFWKFMRIQEQENLRRFMQFLTGSERPPIFGFSKLQSNRNNVAHFCIQAVKFDKSNPFPKAHTCFNRLQLPCYKNQKDLTTYLTAIIRNDLEGIYGLD